MPKNGIDNLKPPRTKDEARERGQNGGKASGEARRRKKALKEEFEILLSMPLADKALQDNLSALGVKVNGSMTIQTALTAAMIQQGGKRKRKGVYGDTGYDRGAEPRG